MSNNNKFFLFFDNKRKTMKVYKIEQREREDPITKDTSNQYEFTQYYTLNHTTDEASKLFEAIIIFEKEQKKNSSTGKLEFTKDLNGDKVPVYINKHDEMGNKI